MEKDNLKFVIVGHVDHGKSTLVGRILIDTKSLTEEKIGDIEKAAKGLGREMEPAFLLDHLKEEREQGITIDTTQTFFRNNNRDYVIIDAPGHVEFVKNMVTGASNAEAAILIIDAKEGVKEQTKRHANILAFLNISQIIVAVNKMDGVGFDKLIFESISNDVKYFLSSLGLNAQYFVPTAALFGDNVVLKSNRMNWYNGPTILEALEKFQPKTALTEKLFILPVQDVYRTGDERIIAGNIESGKIRVGQNVTILPSGRNVEVKAIKIFGKEPYEALAGESIGICLDSSIFIERGDIMAETENNLSATDTIFAKIFSLERSGILKGDELLVKCATQEVLAKISEIKKRFDSSTLQILEGGGERINYLEVAEVVIKTRKPIVIANFNDICAIGRFVLVKNENICAGGIIA